MGVEIRSDKEDKPVKDLPIELVDLQKLVPHEMTIETELKWFINGAKESGMVHWGLLVDEESMLILDGHHRTEGLKRMGYKQAPVHLIDYHDDDLVSLHTWYPLVDAQISTVVDALEKVGLSIHKVKEFDKEELKNRNVTAYIGNKDHKYAVEGEREDIFEQVRDRWLEGITYIDDMELCFEKSSASKTSIVAWSYLKKKF